MGKFKIYGQDLNMEFRSQKFEFQILHTLTLFASNLDFDLRSTLYPKLFEGFFAQRRVFGAKCKMSVTRVPHSGGVCECEHLHLY